MRFHPDRHFLVVKCKAADAVRELLGRHADERDVRRCVLPSLREAATPRRLPAARTGDRFAVVSVLFDRPVEYVVTYTDLLAHDGHKRCAFLEEVRVLDEGMTAAQGPRLMTSNNQ